MAVLGPMQPDEAKMFPGQPKGVLHPCAMLVAGHLEKFEPLLWAVQASLCQTLLWRT